MTRYLPAAPFDRAHSVGLDRKLCVSKILHPPLYNHTFTTVCCRPLYSVIIDIIPRWTRSKWYGKGKSIFYGRAILSSFLASSRQSLTCCSSRLSNVCIMFILITIISGVRNNCWIPLHASIVRPPRTHRARTFAWYSDSTFWDWILK